MHSYRGAMRCRSSPTRFVSSTSERALDGTVNVADYEAVGGVIGALQRRADRVLDDLTRRGRGQIVLPTLLKLAAVDGEGEPTRRRLEQRELDAEEHGVVEAFVDARVFSQALLQTMGTPPSRSPTRPCCGAGHRCGGRSKMPGRVYRCARSWSGSQAIGPMRGARSRICCVAAAYTGIDQWAGQHSGDLTPDQREYLAASRAWLPASSTMLGVRPDGCAFLPAALRCCFSCRSSPAALHWKAIVERSHRRVSRCLASWARRPTGS